MSDVDIMCDSIFFVIQKLIIVKSHLFLFEGSYRFHTTI